MAKVTRPLESKRLPATQGRLLFYERAGRIIVGKWPRKRPENLTDPRVRPQIDRFTEAMRVIRVMPGVDHYLAHFLTKGSPWYPSDYLIKLLHGTLFGTLIVDGKRIFPMAARDDLSAWLDALGPYDGGLLIRQNGVWTTLQPGADGRVLTMQNGLPTWMPAAGGGSTFIFPAVSYTDSFPNFDNTAHNFKGVHFQATRPLRLHAITALVQPGTNTEIAAAVIEITAIDANTWTAGNLIATTTAIQAPTAGRYQATWDLPTPIDWPQDASWGILIYRPGAAPSSSTNMFFTGASQVFRDASVSAIGRNILADEANPDDVTGGASGSTNNYWIIPHVSPA